MSDGIGKTAGQVWSFLESNGPATAARIQKAIGADAPLTNQALGWLAREGKLKIERSKKATRYSLCE